LPAIQAAIFSIAIQGVAASIAILATAAAIVILASLKQKMNFRLDQAVFL